MVKISKALPGEIWTIIFEYHDPFKTFFKKNVIPEILLFRCKTIAKYYIGIPCQYFKSYFRYYNNKRWYTISFSEISYNKYQIIKMNEKSGTAFCHIFIVPGQNMQV